MGEIMENRLLIAPGDTRLGEAVASEAERSGYRVALGVARTVEGQSEEQSPLLLEWNRRSLLSARNLVLQTVNALGGIDVSVVIHEPVPDAAPTHELSPAAIERQVDYYQKSGLHLIRELLACYMRQKAGMLSLIHYAPENVPELPLSAAASAAFCSTTEALFELYQNEEFIINGFDCTKEGPARFARFYFQTIEGKTGHGKWHRYGAARRKAKSRMLRSV
jgi:hypothetical protein